MYSVYKLSKDCAKVVSGCLYVVGNRLFTHSSFLGFVRNEQCIPLIVHRNWPRFSTVLRGVGNDFYPLSTGPIATISLYKREGSI